MSATKNVNVAFMTSGGLAPCLSSSIAHLVHYWVEALRGGKISGLTLRMYIDGYKGVLTGDSFLVPEESWDSCTVLQDLGGSPIGNSRVKVRLCFAWRMATKIGLSSVNDISTVAFRCYDTCLLLNPCKEIRWFWEPCKSIVDESVSWVVTIINSFSSPWFPLGFDTLFLSQLFQCYCWVQKRTWYLVETFEACRSV